MKERQIKEVTNLRDIEFYLPTKIIFKENAVDEVGNEAAELGKRALLVTGKKAMKRLGITSKVKDLLENSGVEVTIYDQVEPEPSIQTVDDGGRLARSKSCDLIMGLGGGSVLDASKGISVVAAQGGSIVKYLEGGDKKRYLLGRNVLPVLAVPTTSGTGSEVTPFMLFTDREERKKKALGDPVLYPKRAIIDPGLMMRMPPRLAAITGVDALGHAVEAYISRRAHMLSDMHAREAICLITKNLHSCVASRNNKEAQKNMSWASTLAGIANSQVGTVVGHAMAVSFGGYFGISHGMAVALFLPYALELNRTVCPQKLAQIAAMFGENLEGLSVVDAAKKSVEACRNFIKDVGLPSHFGRRIDDDLIFRLAKDAFTKPAMKNNPAKLELDDVVAAIRQILE